VFVEVLTEMLTAVLAGTVDVFALVDPPLQLAVTT
jgi:hypothetical protein